MFSFLKKRDNGAPERRQYGRVAISATGVSLVAQSLRTKDRLPLQIVELNQAGVRFRGTSNGATFMKGESVEVTLTLEGKPLMLCGEVAWVKASGRDFEGGIHFDSVTPGEQSQLLVLMKKA